MGGLARSRHASEWGVMLMELGHVGDIGTDWDPMAW